jgi:hypothetical protein
MDTQAATTHSGDSLPQSTFASRPIRRTSTSASAPSGLGYALLLILLLLWLLLNACGLGAQQPATQHFLNQRLPAPNSNTTPAIALQRARAQHLQLLQQRALQPHTANLTAAWQPLGPNSILSSTFGALTGRITALAPDPNDTTGNTLYVGTSDGGVWKSTNAAGSSPTFNPLTDTLAVFASGTSAIASLSIGALAVQPAANPVLLAGTGDPNSATDSLYGQGLLRSTDGGLTWSLIQFSRDGTTGDHYWLGLSVSGIAFSTAAPSLVVAAFSTATDSAETGASTNYSTLGLYASTDAGLTWKLATLYDGAVVMQQPEIPSGQINGNAVTSVVWNPIRKSFFAAVRNHGYYASTDGLTWTRLANQPGTGLTTANCPALIVTGNCPIYRGTLAVQPVTGDTYALTVDASDLDQGLWQDLCNAASNNCASSTPSFANRIDNAALEVGSGNTAVEQGTYNLTLAAAPTTGSGTLLFAGTIDLYRCSLTTNASTCALRNTTNALNGCNAPAAVAPAQHALSTVAQPSGTPILYLGNDGGLWRSLDGVAETGPACSATDASHFNNLNPAFTGSLSEVTNFAQHPTDPNTLIAGIGANGSALTFTATTQTQWPQISAGEGGTPLLDPNTPNTLYAAIGSGINLRQCTLGNACTATNFIPPAIIGGPQVSNDTALLDAPTLLDPALTTNLIAGTCRVWRGSASTGTTWSPANAISPTFDGSTTPCTANSPLIRSLAAGGPSTTSTNAQLSGSQVIYAGIAGSTTGGNAKAGHLYVTKNANISPATWTDTALPNASQFDVSSIAVDPHDATGATVYATIMGFSPTGNLYRSTDFGAHWTNLSSNLPEAPANAVLVDPNDANTVYIALDTGVYVTQAVSTCPTTNCWSVLGTALPNSPVTALAAAAQMPTGDGRLGMLRASTYGRGLWQTPLLTAISLAQPALSLSTNSLTFSAQQVSTQSTAQTLTLTSTGNAAVIFGTPAIAGDFAIASSSCTGTLAINAQCSIGIVFTPTATGPRSGQLTIYANIPTGQTTVTLSGTGTAPASIVLTPPSLTFAATLVNQITAAQIITIANTGGTAATLQAPVVTGDFAISANTCTATLPASTACSVSITFTPSASGARIGSLSITDSAGTQTAQLSGTGNAPATDTLSPTSLTFAAQQITTASPAQQVTLTNSGDVALTLITASLPSADFSVTSACGNSLAAHATCAFSVTFTPTATGTRTATLSISDQFRTQTVVLSGNGTAPPGVSLTPSALTFPATGVGLTSAAQTLTLTNNGGQPLGIPSFTLSAGFLLAVNTCTTTLAVNAACTVTLVYSPTVPGPATGSLTVVDNAPSSPQTVTLTGTGIDFTLTANGPTSATLASGTSAAYSLIASSLTGLSGTIALSCAGAPTNAICNVNPASASLGSNTSVIVTVQTGVQARVDPPSLHLLPIAYALLLPAAFLLRRGRLPPLCLLLCLLTVIGCGPGRVNPEVIPPTASTPTPSGTYNLTVTASSAGLTRSVGLTLTVQ